MEYLKSSLNLQITHVPYKGTGQSVPALVGGQVPMVFSGYRRSLTREGRAREAARDQLAQALGAGSGRSGDRRDDSRIRFRADFGLFAPNGTPRTSS